MFVFSFYQIEFICDLEFYFNFLKLIKYNNIIFNGYFTILTNNNYFFIEKVNPSF